MALKVRRNSAIDALVEKILRRAGKAGRHEIDAWKKPQKELRELARLDYVRVMRRTLDYHGLRAIIGEASKIWPNLNRAPLRPASADQLASMSSELRIHLQASPYCGPEGMALRGFYVDKARKVLKRPLIYLNTAHHPGAVQATFVHEMGHHVTAKSYRQHDRRSALFFSGRASQSSRRAKRACGGRYRQPCRISQLACAQDFRDAVELGIGRARRPASRTRRSHGFAVMCANCVELILRRHYRPARVSII